MSAPFQKHPICTENSCCKISAWLKGKIKLGKKVDSRESTMCITRKNILPGKTMIISLFPL